MPFRGTLYVARHGETDWNAMGRLQGATDIPLNDRGRAQAEALATLLEGRAVARVAASTLSRAKETATVVAARLNVPFAYEDDDLRERTFGAFEGLTRAECDTRDPTAFRAWLADPRFTPPGAESFEALAERVLRGLRRAAMELVLDGGAALVVTHGQSLRAALFGLTGTIAAPIPNTAVYAVLVDGGALGEARLVTA